MSESEFQRRLSSHQEFGSKVKHEKKGLAGSMFSVPRRHEGQDESNARNEVAEDLNATENSSVEGEIDIKYQVRSIAGNLIEDAEDDLDLDPEGRFIKTYSKPVSPESIHSERKKLYLDLLRCDPECEICLVYIRRLSEHIRTTHVRGQVRLIQDPVLIDPLDLEQSPATEFKHDKGEVVRRERIERTEESGSNSDSDSDPDFNIESESESDPDNGNSASPAMVKMFLRHGMDKLNTRKQKVAVDETSNLNQDTENQTGEMEFKCVTCGKIYMSEDRLALHERTHTGGKQPTKRLKQRKTRRKKKATSSSRSSDEEYTAKPMKKVRRQIQASSSKEDSKGGDLLGTGTLKKLDQSDDECAGDSDSGTDFGPTPKSSDQKSRRRRKTFRKNFSKTHAGEKVNHEGATNFVSNTRSASQPSQKSQRKSNKNPSVTETRENDCLGSRKYSTASQGLSNTRGLEKYSKGDGRGESDRGNRKPLHRKMSETVSKKYRSKTDSVRKSYKCGECGKYFPKLLTLTEHNRVHTDERPFKCDVCKKSFKQSSHLTYHKKVHTDERPYKCDMCVKSFIRSSDLSCHKKVHTSERPFKCDVCEKGFNTPSELIQHKRVHTGERPYKCDVCDKSFKISSNLTHHKRVHTGETPYKCDVCMKRFATSFNLSTHKRIHTGIKPYKCSECQKCFSQSGNLSTHMKSHKEKTFNCEVCLKSFTQKIDLVRHMRSHSGEKPYKCETCDKCFTTSNRLTKHKSTHNPS